MQLNVRTSSQLRFRPAQNPVRKADKRLAASCRLIGFSFFQPFRVQKKWGRPTEGWRLDHAIVETPVTHRKRRHSAGSLGKRHFEQVVPDKAILPSQRKRQEGSDAAPSLTYGAIGTSAVNRSRNE